MSFIATYLLAIGAGVSAVIQQAVNANLRAEIGSVWWAGFISYVVGTLAMLLMVVLLREPVMTMQVMQRTQLISWTGGIFGVVYIATSILLFPRLGAATVITLAVAGQMLGSLVFDHFGILGVPVHEISVARLTGAALLVTGVILIRL